MHPYHVALATTSPGDIVLNSHLRQTAASVSGVAIFTVERLFSLLDLMSYPERDEALELYFDAYLPREEYFFDLPEEEAQLARYQALRRRLVEMWQNQSFESVPCILS